MRGERFVFVVAIMVIGTLVLAAAAVAQGDLLAEERELREIQRIIEEKGYHWKAGKTSVWALSPQEKETLLGLRVPPDYEQIRSQQPAWPGPGPATDFSEVFDWREMEGVSEVKDQEACGSCWDFCAVGAFESQILIYDGVEEDLSEQQVLSCNTHGDGCDGGWMSTAYEIFQDPGSVSEACMPYQADDTVPCRQQSCEKIAHIDTWYAVDNSVTAIKNALLVGPVATAMTVYGDFFAYQEGCYEHEGTENVNHGVLIVGWDDTMCVDEGAWIVKNSWGPNWGLDGFFYIKYNNCNIGYGTDLLEYTPRWPVVRYKSYQIQDDLGDGDGRLDPGETAAIPVTLKNRGKTEATGVSATLSTTTPGAVMLDDQAEFEEIPPHSSATSLYPHFTVQVDQGVSQGTIIYFQILVVTDQESCDYHFSVPVGDVVFYDDAEQNRGWVFGVPDDDAQNGRWARGAPEGDGYQPGADHTPSWGESCFVTGVRVNQDVYDGKTTLLSPLVDLSQTGQVQLSYWRYVYDVPGDDDLVVDISSDGGRTWTNLETVHGGAVGWRQQTFLVEEFITPTDSVQLRFIAEDKPENSRCEALVDDFVFLDLDPPRPLPVSQLRAFLAGGTDIALVWSAVTHDEQGKEIVVSHYTVYRETEPYFSPEDAESIGVTSDTTFLDEGAAQTPPNFFYAVTATANGRESEVSARSGEFDRFLHCDK